MRLLIDASNICAGGGVSHLAALLGAANPKNHGFSEVIVCAPTRTLAAVPDQPWLVKHADRLLDKGILLRRIWQATQLPSLLKRCDVLFVPGGIYHGNFRPFVTMAQNLLPFMPFERRRFGLSYEHLRCFLLEVEQTQTFRNANGVVYVSEGSREIIEQRVGFTPRSFAIIHHGVDRVFFSPPRRHREGAVPRQVPFRLLYVSIINTYKHQTNVVRAVARLRERGVQVELKLVGASYAPSLKELNKLLDSIPSAHSFVSYEREVRHTDLPSVYREADGFIFASSCETFGIILVEAMASGLAIACSDRKPLPEIADKSAIYFDPENTVEIEEALFRLCTDETLRTELENLAFMRAARFNWEDTAEKTFSFLCQIGSEKRAIEG